MMTCRTLKHIAAPRDMTNTNLAPSPTLQNHTLQIPTTTTPQIDTTMADTGGQQTGIILSTAFTALLTGYVFGVWTIRGYLISPDLVEERRRALHDPEESEESDVDEDDSLLDHAPNWANGPDADRRQGLKVEEKKAEKKEEPVVQDNGEECKLVLVVRTDLGMTKGMCHLSSC